ncbi:MAG TPA: hypothetical protein VFP93_04660 [Gammaproteobacteria bacterium]|nr:hypothetical protein [Gammaproteobacteria bacterium]
MSHLATKLKLFIVLSLCSQVSHALIIHSDPSHSLENLGDFQAEVHWDGLGLNIQLTNLSEPTNGGYITGFLMNLPGDTTFQYATTDSKFSPLMPEKGPYYGTKPYGYFDYGFTLGGSFLGGGKPHKGGIGVGQSANFTLAGWLNFPDDLDINNADVVENYFFDALKSPELGSISFLTRFRGFEDEGSDKVPGVAQLHDLNFVPLESEIGSNTQVGPTAPHDIAMDIPQHEPFLPEPLAAPSIGILQVPIPSTVFLILTGLIGLMVRSAKFRSLRG